MRAGNPTLNEEITRFCEDLSGKFKEITTARKEKLAQLSDYISGKKEGGQTPKVVVICTHNSRRSHIGQLWLAVGADYFGIDGLQTFSGGTEATAFNSRAVKAFQRVGFNIVTEEETDNPVYLIKWKEDMAPYRAFSKKYQDVPNPQKKFAAVMVCSQADDGCPFVLGSDFRLSLPFDDPKEFDETDLETAKYDERVRQIGREMLFVMSRVNA